MTFQLFQHCRSAGISVATGFAYCGTSNDIIVIIDTSHGNLKTIEFVERAYC